VASDISISAVNEIETYHVLYNKQAAAEHAVCSKLNWLMKVQAYSAYVHNIQHTNVRMYLLSVLFCLGVCLFLRPRE